MVVYSSEVWLFYYPVSYLTALFGIGIRKAPQKVRAGQAVVQVAIKVAEEYLPGGEELSEALRNLFFERAEEVIIQEQEEKEEKDQVMAAVANVAAAEVRRANQLMYDQIAALETFTGDSYPGLTGRRTSEG